MNTEMSQKETLLYRTLLALALIALAAALRVAPHPWNFTPVGAMALFSGAVFKDRRLAFIFPLVALFAGDIFIGFHKLLPIVYASFLVNVAIGLWLRDRRTAARITLAMLLGAIWMAVGIAYGAAKTILLSPGESVEDVDLKLVRGAVITGRVTDEEGKPVVEERIELQPADEKGGQRQMSPFSQNYQMFQTDDRGIYRLYGLPAGRYKVSVGSNPNNGFSGNGARG